MEASGRCLCGAVSFVANDVEQHFHACHCDMCRRWSGGPAMAVPVGGIRFEGADHIGRYRSSEWAERGFCKACGSNLFYRLTGQDHYIVWVGTFDDSAPFELEGEIFIEQKPPGYAFAGEHPRLTGEEFLASLSDSGETST
jgi:hypothetical protein